MVRLWMWAMEYALDGDLSRFTDQEVAQAMGFSLDADPTLISALKKNLVASGFLDSNEKMHDWKDRNKYLRSKQVAMRKLRAKRGTRVTPVLPVTLVPLPLNGTDLIGSEQNRSTPPLPPVGGDEFERFYQTYPRKEARGDAEKAWKQTARDRPPIEALLSAISLQRSSDQWTKEGGQFIPLPAGWLRKKRWADVVTRNYGSDEPQYQDPASAKRILEIVRAAQEKPA